MGKETRVSLEAWGPPQSCLVSLTIGSHLTLYCPLLGNAGNEFPYNLVNELCSAQPEPLFMAVLTPQMSH
jgi:hypothetical protein